MIFAITLHQPWRGDTQTPPPFFPFVTQLPLSKGWRYYKISEMPTRQCCMIKKNYYGIFIP